MSSIHLYMVVYGGIHNSQALYYYLKKVNIVLEKCQYICIFVCQNVKDNHGKDRFSRQKDSGDNLQ